MPGPLLHDGAGPSGVPGEGGGAVAHRRPVLPCVRIPERVRVGCRGSDVRFARQHPPGHGRHVDQVGEPQRLRDGGRGERWLGESDAQGLPAVGHDLACPLDVKAAPPSALRVAPVSGCHHRPHPAPLQSSLGNLHACPRRQPLPFNARPCCFAPYIHHPHGTVGSAGRGRLQIVNKRHRAEGQTRRSLSERAVGCTVVITVEGREVNPSHPYI